MPHDHDARVDAIRAQVQELAAAGERIHIHKGGVHHVVPLPGDPRFRTRPVDISALDRVLSVDPVARTCTSEPGATFARVVAATLAHGLLPMVVPELEGITVGGAVAGCSVESMSFRYGGFHDSCVELEVVTAMGERLVCSPEQDPELFHMMHGSYGTLGLVTKLVFRLVAAKPYVRTEYRTFPSFAAFQQEMLRLCREPGDVDFIDGIVHAADAAVLCLGRFTDEAPYVSSYRSAEVFYRSTRTRTEDVLTTADYCFRYDTECHWLTRTFPPLEWRPVRWVAGGLFLGSENLIRWAARLGPVLSLVQRRPDVVVDVFIPSRRLGEFWDWYAQVFDYFPLWIVPYRLPRPYPWVADALAARMQDDLFVDCAVYGMRNNARDVDLSELLERKTYELDGIKTLISRNHYTEQTFWESFDRPRYEAMKRRVDPDGLFRGLYEKFARVG